MCHYMLWLFFIFWLLFYVFLILKSISLVELASHFILMMIYGSHCFQCIKIYLVVILLFVALCGTCVIGESYTELKHY